jgi:hypothetical protein
MVGCGTSNIDVVDTEAANPEVVDPPASDQPTDPVEAPGAVQPDQGAPRQAALPAPWVATGGATTATVTASRDSAIVQIDGGAEAAAYGLVSYRIVTGAMSATAEFTVNPAPGASFEYMLAGTGSGYSSRYLLLERLPGSDVLQAATTTGSGRVACGTVASGQPTTVTLAFDGATKTFDVLIAGAATACTHLPTKAAGPVNGFRLSDSPAEGRGGHVEFSDLTLLY